VSPVTTFCCNETDVQKASIIIHIQTKVNFHILMNIKIVKSKSKLKWLNKFNRNLCMALNISAHCTATHTYTSMKSVSLHVDTTEKFL